MAALRRAFPPAEWDVLTTTIDAQIADEDKQHPARWLRQLYQHYLGEEPIIQKNLATLTFTQVIFKARDFEAGPKTESAITKHHLEEAAHKVSPAAERPKTPHYSNRRVKDRPSGPSGSSTCPWCGRTPHPNRRDCPASNDTCHGCGKRGHWKQVCRTTPIHVVSEAATSAEANQQDFIVTHEVYQVQATATKGIYTTHGHLHDELVYRVEFEDNNPELSGFRDATVQEIRTEASTDPEQKALRTFVETGSNDKASVPVLIHPYWSVRHELTIHDGLLFKQDRVVIPSSLRSNILRKLHTAHRGTEFTLRHARSCKSRQKKAYDKHAGPPLPKLPPGSYVYAKPPPTSSAKAWIPGEIVGPAGPRSYLIQTGTSLIRRNRVQLQLAPSPSSFKPLQPPTNKPQSYTSDSGTPQLSLGSSSIADPAPVPTPTTPAPTASSPTNSESPLALETSSPMCPSPPCTTGRPPALSNPVPHSSPTATNTPTGQTVTRSGR
ncbi:hypothetical protein P5673_015370, partial [Acropora cervicornis]